MYRFFTLLILINIYFSNMVHGSGAFDHGTSTGKGKIQIDLTWNPFNYFKNGQSYIMMGYGILERSQKMIRIITLSVLGMPRYVLRRLGDKEEKKDGKKLTTCFLI